MTSRMCRIGESLTLTTGRHSKATARPVTPAPPFPSCCGRRCEAHPLSHVLQGSSPCVGSLPWIGVPSQHQQKVSNGRASKASSVSTATPQGSRYRLSSGLPLTLYYSELFNYFTTYHNIIIIEINCTIHVMHLNHLQTTAFPPSVEKLSSMTSPRR